MTAIWGMTFVILKEALTIITPLYFNFFRFTLAALILACCCGKERLKKLNPKHILPTIILGTALWGVTAFQNIGLQYTTAANAAFISGTNIILVPLLAWFYYKKINKWQILLCLLTAISLAVFTLDQNLQIHLGDFL
ncbi:MAG: DMT family transporter, partial [Clostridiales bacterium]